MAEYKNLINRSKPYVHIDKNDLVNVAYQQLGISASQDRKNRFGEAKKQLEEWEQKCKKIENQFYDAYNIPKGDNKSRAIQWSNKFLLNNSNEDQDNIFKQARKIILSDKMYGFLIKSKNNDDIFYNKIKNQINTKEYYFLLNYFNENSILEDSIANAVLGIKNNRKFDNQLNYYKALKDAFKVELRDFKKELNSKNSDYFKELSKEIRKKYGGYINNIEGAKKYFNEELTAYVNRNFKGEEKVKNQEIKDKLVEYFNEQLDSYGDNWFSFNYSGVKGNADEGSMTELMNFQIEYENSINENKIKVDLIRTGNTLVDRFGDIVKGKTDILVVNDLIKDAGSKGFSIQMKNSDTEIYSFLESGIKNDEMGNIKFGMVNIQNSIQYTNFMEKFNSARPNGKVSITDDDLDVLSYLMANIAVLNKYQKGKDKLYKRADKLNVPEASLFKLVEDILGKGIEFFISDYIVQSEDSIITNINSINFFIFKQRLLIPVSSIIREIRNGLENLEQVIFIKPYFDTRVGNFAYSITERNKLKDEWRIQNGKKIPGSMYWANPDNYGKWYTEDKYINYGTQVGEQAISNMVINSIKMGFKLLNANNLINRTL